MVIKEVHQCSQDKDLGEIVESVVDVDSVVQWLKREILVNYQKILAATVHEV